GWKLKKCNCKLNLTGCAVCSWPHCLTGHLMLTIYHNPRCSKSRETLALLQQQSQPLQIIEYLKTPPTEDELRHLLQLLGLSARQLLRTKEEEYRQLGLADTTLSEQQLIAAMVA